MIKYWKVTFKYYYRWCPLMFYSTVSQLPYWAYSITFNLLPQIVCFRNICRFHKIGKLGLFTIVLSYSFFFILFLLRSNNAFIPSEISRIFLRRAVLEKRKRKGKKKNQEIVKQLVAGHLLCRFRDHPPLYSRNAHY